MAILQETLRLKRNRIKEYSFLISEYDLVKAGNHPLFKGAIEFYKAHGLDRSTFLKYRHRFKQNAIDSSLLPRKPGPPLYKTRRISVPKVENKVLELRKRGCSRYEIATMLRPVLKEIAPSPSSVYAILKRHGVNKLTVKDRNERRKIIKEKAGELAHVDCHRIDKSLISGCTRPYYLVGVIDDCTRVAWCEVVENIQSLTVMFSTLRCINMICEEFGVKFAEMITDNGSEFGGRPDYKNKKQHPFERMLLELEIKHRYTRPFRPQTNGKIERFWKTLKYDMLENTLYESVEKLREELVSYLVYYNYERPHQGIDGKTPVEVLKSVDKLK